MKAWAKTQYVNQIDSGVLYFEISGGGRQMGGIV